MSDSHYCSVCNHGQRLEPEAIATLDAVKLARDRLAAVEGFKERNPESDGEMIAYLDGSVHTTLARCVIAQAEELERVRKALGEALDEWERSDCCWQHRIAELRRLPS